MQKMKQYFLHNFEQTFIFVILVTVFVMNYYVNQKLAFLNFYFLPIIMAGYYLGLRRSILGAVFCISLVFIYITVYPKHFIAPTSMLDVYLNIVVWGGFLILAGFAVGKLQQKFSMEYDHARELNKKLEENQQKLQEANESCERHNKDLETRVKERTLELQRTKDAVETLKGKVEETLYTTMDSAVARLMIEGRMRSEKRKIGVMFTDLVSFTSFSEERNPEMTVRDLNRYLADMEPTLHAFRGHIDKYMGDGIMCEFGAPTDYETYRLQTVIAALKMQEKMSRGDYPWKMRIGIASGSAILGLIGSKRKSYTAIGDVVNLASRMEKMCPPGSVLIDDYTLQGAHQFIDVKPFRDVNLSELQDGEAEAKLEELHLQIRDTTDEHEKATLYHEIGKQHLSLDEVYDALDYFERAVKIQPDNVELKVVFAEAAMKRDKQEKIKIRGKKNWVGAHEVIGVKDMLLDREKIPQALYDAYRNTTDLNEIPEDITLPVEALDGCIGHSRVVAFLSFAIASELGLSEQEKLEIMRSAFLADIGKEIIPHHLLNRQGLLNNDELLIVKKHPEEGTHMLKKIGYDTETVLEIVRHSHEKFNGTGHPAGLAGEKIPLGSRIVAVADAYDALTSWRPYREKFERKVAMDEINQSVEKGVFDPHVVSKLDKLLG